MLSHKLKPHTIEISKPHVKSFKGAYAQYKIYLEEKKAKEMSSEQENNVTALTDDIVDIKSKVRQMLFQWWIWKFSIVWSYLSYVIKGNGLKRKSDKTKADIAFLENEIEHLIKKKRKINPINAGAVWFKGFCFGSRFKSCCFHKDSFLSWFYLVMLKFYCWILF